MKILRNLKVPTGNILVVKGERLSTSGAGQLEMISVGDYGKDVNLKAGFLGLDRKPERVHHTKMLPLSEKWVITISTQYGCSMGCEFCDVPLVGSGKNATFRDLTRQVLTGLSLHPDEMFSKRLNVHFARMGEPTWNPAVLDAAKWLKRHIDSEYNVHPVVSTMMPRKNEWLKTFIHTWMRIKNRLYRGNAGLQISINSTCELERREQFSKNACSLDEIGAIMEGVIPNGRKITLNFALANYEIDPKKLLRHFHPDDYVIKLTPMHKTKAAEVLDIRTPGDYTEYEPYAATEMRLRDAGYDVIVFIASKEEDDGLITCGNAILSGSLPRCEYEEVQA